MKSNVYNLGKKIFYLTCKVSIWMNLFRARLFGKTVVYILGTPVHQNIGDLAILKAEVDFIRKYIDKSVVVKVPLPFLVRQGRFLNSVVRDEDILMGHGGGNMGDTYMEEENCRRKFVARFKNNNIIIFPQTIFFSDTEKGVLESRKTASIYAKHQHLTLIAREEISFKRMKELFPSNNVLLTPDIVLSTSEPSQTLNRQGALVCLRNDIEATLQSEDRRKIVNMVEKHFNNVKYTDTISHSKFFFITPKNYIVNSKLKEFKTSEFVITDRLHGMVFAAITGTPCIAMTNFNHKVKGTFKWISQLPYIQFCDDVNDLDKLMAKIKLGQDYQYNPGDYDQYWKKIVNSIVR